MKFPQQKNLEKSGWRLYPDKVPVKVAGPEWSELSIRYCLAWRLISPKDYDHARVSKLISAPSRSTLDRYIGNVDCDVGISPLVKSRLQIECENLEPMEKIVSIIADEMAIKERLLYDRTSDKFFEIVNAEGIYDECVGKYPTLANKLLCFVVNGLSKRFTIPAAYYLVKGLQGQELYQLFNQVIKAVEDCGFYVLRIVTDNHKTNVSMFRQFGNGDLKFIRFSGDPVEALFSTVRMGGGSNDVTDARTAAYAIKRILKSGLMIPSKAANVTGDNAYCGETFPTGGNSITDNGTENDLVLPDHVLILLDKLTVPNDRVDINLETVSQALICGYLIRVIEEKTVHQPPAWLSRLRRLLAGLKLRSGAGSITAWADYLVGFFPKRKDARTCKLVSKSETEVTGGQEGRTQARGTGNMCPGVELTDEGMYGLCLRVVTEGDGDPHQIWRPNVGLEMATMTTAGIDARADSRRRVNAARDGNNDHGGDRRESRQSTQG
ncbi:hypothetical protein ANN_26686 [Periplaneta americana]|uniref:Transposable element P transposase-like RNase H domain-containing protein n=1 Tax=Periplaneta americana TaxID=6978 RepID=A0ABQ8RZ16_PERAM|nr:hypothetical protein ANN_26686 [Periplaneta americana]